MKTKTEIITLLGILSLTAVMIILIDKNINRNTTNNTPVLTDTTTTMTTTTCCDTTIPTPMDGMAMTVMVTIVSQIFIIGYFIIKTSKM